MKLEDIYEILKKKGINPSHHRINVFEYFIEHESHPTVDEIYRDIIKKIPTLSKTTIYNTLNLFLEKGLVQTISVEENETRYDLFLEEHSHFKCVECGKLYNLEMPELKFKENPPHRIVEKHIVFKGVCQNCINQKSGD
jgi:Fe2+ or Zn2+ uptake regulation protein